MKQWQHQLDLSDLWRDFDSGKLNVQQVADRTAARLQRTPFCDNPDLVYIMENFELVTDLDEYTEVMDQLYDFGDEGKRLLVITEAAA